MIKHRVNRKGFIRSHYLVFYLVILKFGKGIYYSYLNTAFLVGNDKGASVLNGIKLIYRTLDCRVQTARSRKGMEWHPCKPVGETEYSGFAKTIDDRITCRCISCYPEITDQTCACSWEFTLNE